MKSIFNLVCLAIVILASHYASANQNEFKINAEIIDYDPSKKIISLDGAISMTSDDFQISGTTATISMNEEVISIEGNPARINLENPEKIFGEAKQIKSSFPSYSTFSKVRMKFQSNLSKFNS